MAISNADENRAATGDKRSLLELAVDIHTDLGKLATGLAHAGADPHAVAGLQRISEMIAGIAKALGNGPVGSEGQPGAEAAPGAGPAAPEQAGPAESAGPPPAAAPPPPEAPQGARPGERPSALHEATRHLQAALAASRQSAGR